MIDCQGSMPIGAFEYVNFFIVRVVDVELRQLNSEFYRFLHVFLRTDKTSAFIFKNRAFNAIHETSSFKAAIWGNWLHCVFKGNVFLRGSGESAVHPSPYNNASGLFFWLRASAIFIHGLWCMNSHRSIRKPSNMIHSLVQYVTDSIMNFCIIARSEAVSVCYHKAAAVRHKEPDLPMFDSNRPGTSWWS